jgi:glycosyltransferase involved in cell wall biosynthesis
VSAPDLLVVSLGTTRGLRVADAAFVDQARKAGVSAEAVAVGIGAAGLLRRAYPVNDLVEAAAARRATATALERRPRAVVFSTVTAALFAPRLEQPYAIRLDSPAALNRTGPANSVLHPLERRALGGARLVLPWSRAALAALPAGRERALVLPPPVIPSSPPRERERLAVAYVPDPKAKGLDVLCAAWRLAHVPEARLAVFGIEPERARRHLDRTGVPEPPAVEWRGMAPADEFRAALRAAHAFVAAARWEDFGQAQLEALADGALLATVPSGGAYEAFALARELEPTLAADAIDPGALAEAVRAAFALTPGRVERYRREAAMKLAAYSPQALVKRMESEVIPALLR